jgi:hypothetical protein
MTDAMSKPIPKKQRQVKAFAKATIPLWPGSAWVPDKENSAGEKTRSLESELLTEPGDLCGKNSTKRFKIWDPATRKNGHFGIATSTKSALAWPSHQGRATTEWSASSCQTDEPLKEFERALLAPFTVKTQANCDLALDAVAIPIFPNNARAKQNKCMHQGLWKPKALTARNVCARLCKLNAQLAFFPNQTVLLPEDEMKSAFINLCVPDWQQEFLKTGTNECSIFMCPIGNKIFLGCHSFQSRSFGIGRTCHC